MTSEKMSNECPECGARDATLNGKFKNGKYWVSFECNVCGFKRLDNPDDTQRREGG